MSWNNFLSWTHCTRFFGAVALLLLMSVGRAQTWEVIPSSMLSNTSVTTWKHNRGTYPSNRAEMDKIFVDFAIASNKCGSGTFSTIKSNATQNNNPFVPGAANCTHDYFIAEFRATLTVPVTGLYRIAIDGDDAVDLFMGNNVVAEYYGGHDVCNCVSHARSFQLTAGQNYDIRFRYHEAFGGDQWAMKMQRPFAAAQAGPTNVQIVCTPGASAAPLIMSCNGYVDQTSGISWAWKADGVAFGGSGSSAGMTINTPGTHVIYGVASNAGGSVSASANVVVTGIANGAVPPPSSVAINCTPANPINVAVSDTVTCTASASGADLNWYWMMNNESLGVFGRTVNTLGVSTSGMSLNLSAVAANAGGAALARTQVITAPTIVNPTNVSVECTPASGTAPLEVTCIGRASGATAWTWKRDETAFSSNSNTATTIFSQPGNILITGTASNNAGSSSATAAIVVTSPASTTIPAKIEAENYTAMNGVVVESTGDIGGGSNLGYVDNGDWVEYTINVPLTGNYLLDLRVGSAMANTQMQIRNGATLLSTLTVPNTGSWETYQTVSTTLPLTAGVQTIRILCAVQNWNLNWLEFKRANVPVSGISLAPGVLSVEVNKTAQLTATVLPSDASNKTVSYTSSNSAVATVSTMGSVTGIAPGSAVITARTQDGNKTVTAAVTVLAPTVIRVEAENYSAMSGIQTEPTGDVGGGLNVGYVQNGDWVEYVVTAPSAGTYTMNMRVASLLANTQMQVRSGGTNTTITLPSTGAWQTYQTVSVNIPLTAGTQTIRITCVVENWNLNWLELTQTVINSPTNVSISCTPPNGFVPLSISCTGVATGAIAWTWKIGTTSFGSSGNSASTVINQAGSYVITGVASNSTGASSATTTITATVSDRESYTHIDGVNCNSYAPNDARYIGCLFGDPRPMLTLSETQAATGFGAQLLRNRFLSNNMYKQIVKFAFDTYAPTTTWDSWFTRTAEVSATMLLGAQSSPSPTHDFYSKIYLKQTDIHKAGTLPTREFEFSRVNVVLAIRGTFTGGNIGQTTANLSADSNGNAVDEGSGLFVHEGFKTAADRLWYGAYGIKSKLTRLVEDYSYPSNGASVFITGHSLGGAMAQIIAARIQREMPQLVIGGVYTFGSPRVGSVGYAQSFWSGGQHVLVGQKLVHFRNGTDLVTHVAPAFGTYLGPYLSALSNRLSGAAGSLNGVADFFIGRLLTGKILESAQNNYVHIDGIRNFWTFGEGQSLVVTEADSRSVGWNRAFFCEFSPQRHYKFLAKAIGDSPTLTHMGYPTVVAGLVFPDGMNPASGDLNPANTLERATRRYCVPPIVDGAFLPGEPDPTKLFICPISQTLVQEDNGVGFACVNSTPNPINPTEPDFNPTTCTLGLSSEATSLFRKSCRAPYDMTIWVCSSVTPHGGPSQGAGEAYASSIGCNPFPLKANAGDLIHLHNHSTNAQFVGTSSEGLYEDWSYLRNPSPPLAAVGNPCCTAPIKGVTNWNEVRTRTSIRVLNGEEFSQNWRLDPFTGLSFFGRQLSQIEVSSRDDIEGCEARNLNQAGTNWNWSRCWPLSNGYSGRYFISTCRGLDERVCRPPFQSIRFAY